MSQPKQPNEDPPGVFFSIDAERHALERNVESDEHVSRLHTVASGEKNVSAVVRSILQLGTEWLGVENGHLTRVDLARGTHEIVEVSGSHPTVSREDRHSLSATYCRKVIGEDAVLAVQDAVDAGWADDPAHDAFEFATYLSAAVVADSQLYGTVCFVDQDAKEEPVTETEAAVVALLARTIGRVLGRSRHEERGQPTRPQLEPVFRHSPNMINIHDGEGNLIAPNPRLCEETGYEKEELTGMKVWELDREATPEEAKAFWAEMQPGDRHRWEGSYQRKDGSTFPVKVDVQCLDLEGADRFVATARDITERRKAEENLKQSEKLHRETLRNITDAVFITREDGTFTYVCPNSKYIFKQTPEEVEDLGSISALLGSDPAEEQEFGEDREISNIEHSVVDAEGNQHHLLINVRRVSIQEGRRMYTCRDVTARKEAQRELEQQHDLFSKAQRLANVGGWAYDVRSGELTWTEEVYRIYGLPERSHPTVEDGIAHYHPEDQPKIREAFTRAVEDGEPYDLELRLTSGDGEERWIHTRGVPQATNGEVRRVQGSIQDITKQKRRERELEQMQERIELTLEETNSVIFEIDYSSGNVRRHGAFEQFFDLPSGEISTWEDHLDRAVHPDDRAALRDLYDQLAEGRREEGELEYRTNPKFGRVQWIRDSVSVEESRSRRLLGLAQDITKRKKRERRLDAIFNQTYQLTGLLKPDGTLIEANDTALQFGDLTKEEVLGRPLWETDWFQTGEETKERVRASVQRAAEGDFVHHEIEVQGNEEIRIIDFSLRPITNDAGEVTLIIPEGRDITERKEQEQKLQRRKALLEAQAETTISGLLVVDNDRRVSFYNDKLLNVWGIPEERVAQAENENAPDREFLESASDLVENPDEFRKTVGYLYAHPSEESRDLIQLADGRWLDQYSAPIVGDEEIHYGRLWVYRDVTDQHRLMGRLLEVQEKERRRIDQEIHHEMGGLLTSLQFTLGTARRETEENDGSTEHFEQLEELVSDLSTLARTISRKLYPSNLSDSGLTEAFSSLADDVERKHDLDVEVYSEIEPGRRFAPLIERTAYWIVQEALLNAAGRAEAGAAQVILKESGKQLYLHIFDEGAELDASALDDEQSFGLDVIRPRVERLDGDVLIEAIPREGTRISVILPTQLPFPSG